MEHEPGDDPERREAVDHAAPEPDGRRLIEVASRYADLPDPSGHPGGHDLGDQFLVEDEVVAVEVVWDRLEQVPAIRPQAGVILGQVKPECSVLDPGQEAVADELPAGHAATERIAEKAAAEHQVPGAGRDRGH